MIKLYIITAILLVAGVVLRCIWKRMKKRSVTTIHFPEANVEWGKITHFSCGAYNDGAWTELEASDEEGGVKHERDLL